MAKNKKNERTGIESASTVDLTVDTNTEETAPFPANNNGKESTTASSNNNAEKESPRRRSPRNKKLKYDTFRGMQGAGSDEHYKLGRSGGKYMSPAARKNAPKSAF